MSSLSPFDVIKDLSYGKEGLITAENEAEYNPYITNRGFSYFLDTVLYANEMNSAAHVDSLLQHDFYINSLRKKRRFAKWNKREVSSEVEAVMDHYEIGLGKAREVVRVLTREQLDCLLGLMEEKKSKNK